MIRMYDVIMKKRNGEALSKEEIEFFVNGYTNGSIPDYQISALMMAIYFRKMNYEETLNLTMAMVNTGEILDLSRIAGVKVDKHSTGGVGDKTSLILEPMVASLGVKVAKMSGRGLGHTGGTIDKLESFPGFSTALTDDQFIGNVNRIGMAITGQTGNLAPADKKLYALRDVSGTVENISLIASSIMSKKIAAGADAIVLDVKTGSGAFMKNEKDAFALAREMVEIGNGAGRKTIAVVSDMDQPLGHAVGNVLEVREAIETLKGHGPEDLTELCMTLGSHILIAAGLSSEIPEAREKLKEVIHNGKALDKLADFVEAQGGNREDVYHPERLADASITREVVAETSGYLSRMKSDDIGIASMMLGGGRETKDSIIDLSVGVILHKKIGEWIEAGDSIATIYANDETRIPAACKKIADACTISECAPETPALIKGVVI